jgi:hypothetical protein
VANYKLVVSRTLAVRKPGRQAGSTAAPQSPVCRPADTLSERTLVRLRALATSTDSIEGATRDSLRLPAVSATAVTFVKDERTCRRALAAFDRVRRTPQRQRKLHVYRYGDAFFAEDPEVEGRGEYRAIHVFDAGWRYLGTMAAF